MGEYQPFLNAVGSVGLIPKKRLSRVAMAIATQVAHMNVARLRHRAGDPRMAGFIDNVSRVNSIAERSPGLTGSWRSRSVQAMRGSSARLRARTSCRIPRTAR